MSGRVYQGSWSVDPLSWAPGPGDDPNDPVTLEPATRDSALQFSTYRKKAGNVTDEDVRSFASEQGLLEVACQVSYGPFSGLLATQLKDTTWWRYWWLRAGAVHLFVTYNGDISLSARDHPQVDAIMETLQEVRSD